MNDHFFHCHPMTNDHFSCGDGGHLLTTNNVQNIVTKNWFLNPLWTQNFVKHWTIEKIVPILKTKFRQIQNVWPTSLSLYLPKMNAHFYWSAYCYPTRNDHFLCFQIVWRRPIWNCLPNRTWRLMRLHPPVGQGLEGWRCWRTLRSGRLSDLNVEYRFLQDISWVFFSNSGH